MAAINLELIKPSRGRSRGCGEAAKSAVTPVSQGHALRRSLFAGSELAGQRAAMVMSLVQSARLSGHEPWAYLKDVLERLLEHPNHRKAVRAAMANLKTVWSINTNRAVLVVRLGDQIQYTTTAGKYEVATR